VPVSSGTRVCAVLSVAAALALPAAAGAQAVPGMQTERFRLVIEGSSSATSDLDLGATAGACGTSVNVHLTEHTTFLRGRGVVVEFVRFGTGRRAPVLIRRPGQQTAAFTVVGTVTRTSSGTAQRVGPPECVPVAEDLSTGPECGTQEHLRSNMTLGFERFALRLRTSGIGAVSDIRCPASQVFGGTPSLRYEWPTPAQLLLEPLPTAQIFGRRRVVLVRMASRRERTGGPFASGLLTGNVRDTGFTRATIRFIRLT